MQRFLRVFATIGFLMSLLAPAITSSVFAQTFQDVFNFNNPVEYDQPLQLGRSFKSPDSIDECLQRKEFFFNEQHNIWVEGLERCRLNSKGVLSRATYEGVSTDPADEQLCKGKRDGAILKHGVPSEDEARRWSERCSYLGTIGGAGPIGTDSPSSNFSLFFNDGTPRTPSTPSTTNRLTPTSPTLTPTTGTGNQLSTTPAPTPLPPLSDSAARQQAEQNLATNTEFNRLPTTDPRRQEMIQAEATRLQQARTTTTTQPTDFTPVYTGTGIQVPDASLVASGISKERSLIQLIVFYTNATLPYVSVLAVFVFVAAGLFYILSFTNEELHSKAKTMMLYVVIGIVIIFSAYTVVNTLLSFSSIQ